LYKMGLRLFMKKIIPILAIIILSLSVFSGQASAQTSFTEVSAQAGVSQVSPTWGVSWGDVNNDGLEDIYIGNHHYSLQHADVQTPPALFMNLGDLTFQNVADSYGIVPVGDFHGAVWGDYNNDGFEDLFQAQGGNRSQGGGRNKLYKNLGTGLFEEIAVTAGLDVPHARSRGGFWVDYDLDGRLDLYLCSERLTGYPSTLMRNNGDDTFTDVGPSLGLSAMGAIMGTAVDYNNDNLMDIYLQSRDRVMLFRNDGGGVYTDVTDAAGLGGQFYAQDFTWGDYDNDGDMDLYLARGAENDTIQWDGSGIYFMTDVFGGDEKGVDFTTTGTAVTFDISNFQVRVDPSQVYIGASGVHPASMPFTVASWSPEVHGKPAYTPGAETAYYVWEEAGTWYLRSTTVSTRSGESFTGIIKSGGAITSVTPFNFDMFSLKLFPNILFENMGDGTFTDVSAASNTADLSVSISANWADFDNDGYLDLYVVNLDHIFNAPNTLYMNNGDKTFTEVAALSGVEANVGGRGENAAIGDYDNNGFMDIFVANGFGMAPFSFGPHLLYHNNGNLNHWLKVKLVGSVDNRDSVGATVRATIGARTATRQQTGGASRFSQNSQIIHFGLGTSQTVDSLTVRWPSGIMQTLYNVAADNLLTLTEPSVTMTLTPESVAVPLGGKLKYLLTLTNDSNVDLTFDYWTNITLPNGTKYPAAGEFIDPVPLTIKAHSSISKVMSHDIPLGAGTSNYTYNAFVGSYSRVWNEGHFAFTIQP